MLSFAKSVEIVFARYDEPLPTSFCYADMPENLTEKQIRKWKSRRTAAFLLHQLFEKYRLDTAYLQQIKYRDNGRPYIEIPQIDYNISHSGDWVAVIFSHSAGSDKTAVGIDIEHPQKTRPYQNLIRHYANIEEQHGLLADNCPVLANLEQRFHLSWCLREAVLKVSGVGIGKLSSVKHFPLERKIHTDDCPAGKLYFHHTLPFYLCYFYQQDVLSLAANLVPQLKQWQGGKWVPIHSPALLYDVNPRN